ncbi:MAG: SPOR domain-containing protein [Pseudomonadales bacterium]
MPVALTVLLGASTSQAATYTIQIGAFKTPNATFADQARSVGEVYATQRASGVTAVSVGSFDSSAEASSALARIEDNYPGAFVRHANTDSRRLLAAGSGSERAAASATRTAPAARSTTASSSNTSDVFATLSAKERKNVVYLDGVLHFKQGDQFLTLAEYRARNR